MGKDIYLIRRSDATTKEKAALGRLGDTQASILAVERIVHYWRNDENIIDLFKRFIRRDVAFTGIEESIKYNFNYRIDATELRVFLWHLNAGLNHVTVELMFQNKDVVDARTFYSLMAASIQEILNVCPDTGSTDELYFRVDG